VGEFGPEPGLDVRQQIELAAIGGAVAALVERNDAVRVGAATQTSTARVRRIDRSPTAEQARLVGLSQTSRALTYPPTA
jgi:hypothetical protein